MSFCIKCGKEISENANFCSSCGNPAEKKDNTQSSKSSESSYQSEQSYQYSENGKNEQNGQSGQFTNDFIKNINNTADNTAEFDRKDIEDNKLMAVLAYISFLVFVPIFAAPNSKYAKYHANQGLVLFIGEIILGVVMGVLSPIIYLILPYPIDSLFVTLLGLIWIAPLILSILGIINVANNQAKELPFIGKIKILK